MCAEIHIESFKAYLKEYIKYGKYDISNILSSLQ